MDSPVDWHARPTPADWTRGADPTQPNAARMYDYYLGGCHNFEADRQAADRAMAAMPAVRQTARANRAFLVRAVRYMVDHGIRQFLDIGSGIPTVGNVHEVAQEMAPGARVVYVDVDAVAVAHARLLLATNQHASAVLGDLRAPRGVLADGEVAALLDFTEPVGLLLVSVLPFVAADAVATEAVRVLRDVTATGSYLALTHGIPAMVDKQEYAALSQVYQTTHTPLAPRTRQQIAEFFGEFELVDPGLVWLPQWRPDSPDDVPDDPHRSGLVAGVARKVV